MSDKNETTEETRDPSDREQSVVLPGFKKWWDNEGSGIYPRVGDDHEEHAERVSEIAWRNGAYKASEGIRKLRNEIDCRIEHGADSSGHLEYVRDAMDSIFNL